MSMNSVNLIGRLGADPELTYTQSGTALAKFRLAVNRPKRKDAEEETDWLDIVCWERTAENVNQYLSSGALVGIEGRIQSRTWEKKDGSTGYAVEINAYRVHFLESKRDRQGSTQAPQQQRQQPAQQQAPQIDWTSEEEDPFADQ